MTMGFWLCGKIVLIFYSSPNYLEVNDTDVCIYFNILYFKKKERQNGKIFVSIRSR